MAVTPIEGRCRRCEGLLSLRDVATDKTGLCPHCRSPISPDRTDQLREHAATAERAQRELVDSLDRLHSLPGNLELIPASVLDNLIGGVRWERTLVDNPDLLRKESQNLKRWGRRWELLHSNPRVKATLAETTTPRR